MPNRLAAETSPYLLQHQDNPVDWYPWGAEAFAEARRRDQPILLSVGYSSCHWCHVMAHESFEDPGTAQLMNRLFVNVKVDREERPDVDAVYMDAVQRMTGRGGWPMTVFLTPEGRPFYAGTYFPRDDRPGSPSFQRVMTAIAHAWAERRAELVDQADRLVEAIDQRLPGGDRLPDQEVLSTALEAVRSAHDPEYGGFGGAPKFPQEPVLEFLLRVEGEPWAEGAAQMARAALEGMARGGIYDHVGGGFARYSVDRRWLIPHFEKMLYTNAQLARLYLRGWQVTGEVRLRRVAVETLDYLLRDLRLPGGGFASAEDADSEGVEGKFYVFDHDEFGDIVGPEAQQIAAAYFGVTREGNFEGANHLHEARTAPQVADDLGVSRPEVEAAVDLARRRLFEVRSRRVRPGLDDKVIASWNGMTIRALAEAGAVLADDRYVEAARRAAGFLLEHLRRPDGRLLRSWGRGRPGPDGFCDDHASLATGLFALYQATADPAWFEEAMVLVGAMVDLFADPDGGFFTTGRDAEALVVRPKDHQDGAHPSANSLAAEALLLAALYTGDAELRRLAEGTMQAGGRLMEVAPTGAGHLLAVLHSLQRPPREVAVVGPEAERLASVVWERFRPDVALAVDRDGSGGAVVPLLEGRAAGDRTLAYVCRDFVCELPVSSPEELRSRLGP